MGLLIALFPLALVAAAVAPPAGFTGLYLLTGATLSAHKIGIDDALVQTSPDDKRALYAGIFGAANLTSAILPLLTGVLVAGLGFVPVFLAASPAAAVALVPLRRIDCGDWYRTA